uniref:Rab-GAP TBC domain-containing protein n=1 Tax=Rhizochromulina marina TaxID=1034831 RepID=A0A7S2WR42_9STRA
MASVAAFLLLVFRGPDWTPRLASHSDVELLEEEVFWTLTGLVDTRLAGFFEPGSAVLLSDTVAAEQVIDEVLPGTTRSLQTLGFDWTRAIASWFPQLYFDALPSHIVAQLWDLVFWFSAEQTLGLSVWTLLSVVCSCKRELSKASSPANALVLLRSACNNLSSFSQLHKMNPQPLNEFVQRVSVR